MNNGSFNITNTESPTNKNVVVVFSPGQNVQKYVYHIFKDGKEIQTTPVNSNKPTNIYLKETGSYQISVVTTDSSNIESTTNSGMYLIDKQSPVLTVSKSEITINKGETIENISIQATDNYDGDIGTNVQSNLSELNLETSGKHQLIYTVSDRAGNVTEKEVTVNVVDTTFNLIMFYSLIIILFTFAVYLITRLQKALKLEKRLDNFTIKPLHDTTKSTIDKFSENYKKTTSVIATYLEKSIFAKKYAKKLEKYTTVSYFHDTGMEILVGKVFVALIFLLIAIIAKIFQLQLLASYEVSLPLIVGFFLLDILYFTKYRLYRNRLENDLLSAIIIMNNAFKSGRSITQAIEIVSEELPGTIGKEFGKMSLELTYGLGIDVVFKRFADRVKIEEVNYLTASLTILNKTGGNIIEVFNSIEKSLFNKKKLKLELKSLTGASKIIIWVLFIVPFLFIVAISFINPEYFMPFITTNIGRILTIFMALYYILFIVCVRKIMKVVI